MTNSMKRLTDERGVSLTELMLTLAVAAIVTGMAAALTADTRRANQGDAAMRSVMAELNGARETAITQRRIVEVQFLGGMWIKTIRHEVVAGQTTVLHTVALEGNIQFSLVPNIPDTPDLFGNTAPVYFGAAQSIQFNGDGALVDSGGTPVNGTVFLSFMQRAISARAVTVLGSTGRVRGYKWISNSSGSGWNRV
jgi:prepilin-type N-terminal cleavage/methylation domain-containing protein